MSVGEVPTPPQTGIVNRPLNQLHDYPVKIRSEVTRRHPYYLVFWEEAALYRQTTSGDQSAQSLLRFAATLMLGSIGVSGEPVNPETDFKNLFDGEPDPAFLTGSVQPMSFRTIVAMLINGLPPAEREVIGALLMASGDETGVSASGSQAQEIRKVFALGEITRIASPALDSFPLIPLFYIHLGASQRSIARDVEDQVRRWKLRRGLGSSKVHTANLESYLKVWDLREGWTGGGYDRTRELSFLEIGRRLKIKSLSTVANRYRSAFEMITGYPFTPELWWRLVGPLKLSELLGGPAAILAAPTLRHLRTRVHRPVPDSTISPRRDQTHSVGITDGSSTNRDDFEYADLQMDLKELIGRGLSDDEIARELELSEPRIVTYFRSRNNENCSI